ncbi:NAD(P)H-binding protein [Actinomadura sp. 3N508]|uniref:NAD(P)H-binding protein n=1 Tax=Actinomadura sp. 3N508 TaxID=3375153 RepID=UPI00378F5A73
MILVVGASGNVGRYVAEELARREAPAKLASRSPDARAWPPNAQVVPMDMADPPSVTQALDGVTKVFLVVPVFAPPRFVEGFIKAARRSGVQRIVYLSSLSLEPMHPIAEKLWADVKAEHVAGEVEIRASGIAHTFLRPGPFMSNAVFQWAESIRSGGVVRPWYGNHPEAAIHPRDVAEVGVRALLEDGHGGRVYDLTGPQLISPAEQVGLIGELLGRPLRFEEGSATAVRETGANREHIVIPQGIMPWSRVRPTLEQVLGRQGATFERWAYEHIELFR